MPRTSRVSLNLPPDLHLQLSTQVPSVENYLTRADEFLLPGDDDHQSKTKQAVAALEDYIVQHMAPPFIGGDTLFANMRDNTRLMPTGCDSLDELLKGGLREGQVLELVGETATGKTQLCMLAAATTASRRERVVYVDSSASFSASRTASMLRPLAAQRGHPDAWTEMLQLIDVVPCHELHCLLEILQDVSALAASKETSQHVTLLVVDSISALVQPVLGAGAGQHSQGHVLMVSAARMLKQLAAAHTLAVIVTNHTVGGGAGAAAPRGDELPRPAMGEGWRVQPHVRVMLTRAGTGSLRHATLMACAIAPSNGDAWFELCERGAAAIFPG